MAEIEITLPTVQYGNVKVRATPEELGVNDISDSYGLGVAAAVYLNLFQQGFRHGATMDVSVSDRVATPGKAASQPSMAPQGAAQKAPRTISQVMSDEDVDTLSEAQAILDKELGVTEVDEYDSATEAKEAVQARTAGAAPWDQKVDAPAKPWETEPATW